MCGICGIYVRDGSLIDKEKVVKMNQALIHRGPDVGQVESYGAACFGHRRLSIIDLSRSADQPMTSDYGRVSLVYNGEIYNFNELRKELEAEGFSFKTKSDTEVFLKAFCCWGTAAFSKLNGMFAAAFYEKDSETVTLVRDQFGIKPLYYLIDSSSLVFASEMKSITATTVQKHEISSQALSEFIWYGNPLGDNTIYEDIKELTPGSFLRMSKDGTEKELFYSVANLKQIDITQGNATEQTRLLFEAAIKRHLLSDVPVGVFLSGGLDSSAIVAVASKLSSYPLKTFSVGFDYEVSNPELPYAKQVANEFSTEHNELYVSGIDLPDLLEKLAYHHDEPFGDAANIPIYLLSMKVRDQIKVVLQGDGGDEIFGGYNRYRGGINSSFWPLLGMLEGLISLSGTTSPQLLRIQRFINASKQSTPYLKNAFLLTMDSKFSNPLRVFNQETREILVGADPFKRYQEVYQNFASDIDPSQAFFYTDTQIILKDTFLEKVDRATMASSIEARVPFLDKELADFIMSLPSSTKLGNGQQKYLFKQAMRGIVPQNIIDRKKCGFGVPYAEWLRTSLYEYFQSQVFTFEMKNLIDENEVRSMLKMHRAKQGNFGSLLWKVLALSIWVNNVKRRNY